MHRWTRWGWLGPLLLSWAGCATNEREFLPITPPERKIATADFQEKMIERFRGHAQALEANPATQVESLESEPLSHDLEWWADRMRRPLLGDRREVSASLSGLYNTAIKHSPQIRVFSDIPLIRETGIDEARGRFTPRFFAEGKYDRRNEPVGSTLTTGGAGRFRQQEWGFEYGVRTRLATGAEATLSHRMTSTNNNSQFFVPDPQSNSSAVLSVVQPLLRGAGVAHNASLIDLASIDTEVAKHEFVRQTESHLLEVNRAYWQLYLARAVYLQKRHLLERTRAIVARLDKRSELDSDATQLIRARAALERREAEAVRSRIAIENSQNRVRALVNDPYLADLPGFELVPRDQPQPGHEPVDLESVVTEAAQRRPEVRQAYLQYEAAALRLGMAENESRSLIDLVAEVSSNGLDDGRHEYAGAFGEGVDHGPSYLIGLRFEHPLGRDESSARLARRRRELRQQEFQVKTTLTTVLLEAQVSVAEYATAMAELAQRKAALRAARADLQVLQERWRRGMGGASGAAQLEFLLAAQERTADAEERLVVSQATHVVAAANLDRVKGSFLASTGLEIERRGEGARGEPPTLRVLPAAQEFPEPPGASPAPVSAGP